MAAQPYKVRAEWDEQAGVWIATSDDVPGLCCEEATFEDLVDTVVALVPDLLIANHVVDASQMEEVPVHVVAERHAIARLMA
jgi:Domain of unknown function (DUF1902)